MILIISAPDDVHAQAVRRELEDLGRNDARIVDLSSFPMRMSIDVRIDSSACDASLTLDDGTVASMDDVEAVWWRRPQMFQLPQNVRSPAHRHFAMAEAATAFQGVWQMSRALWVNDVVRDAAAAHKPWQLALARRVGLDVPETCITNDPEHAREFWARHPGRVVYKPFSASVYAWRETRVLKAEEEALVETVRLAPVIFQEYVPAAVDLRITAIGGKLYPAEAHSQEGEYAIDVRFNTNIRYAPHALPAEIEAKLLGLVARLGLEYGAIDMRLTPDGRYVFLEINPAGQFLYVEQNAGLKIARAFAEHLASGRSWLDRAPAPEREFACAS